MLFAATAGFWILASLLLLGCQRSLIYFPRRYMPAETAYAAKNLKPVHYAVSSGEQTAYYVAPREGGETPDRLWIVFGGNASTALGWLDFTDGYPDKRSAFLLVDFPGYGANPGSPTRTSIVQSATAALAAARAQMRLGDGSTSGSVPLGILGHSMGAAAGLELAVRSNPDRIVLVSPFTTLLAMARRSVGWPLCYLLIDRFNNVARLNELYARSPRPAVAILHGDSDNIIPISMGRALAAAHPDWIDFTAIQNGDHNMILSYSQGTIARRMTEKQ